MSSIASPETVATAFVNGLMFPRVFAAEIARMNVLGSPVRDSEDLVVALLMTPLSPVRREEVGVVTL